MRLRTIGLLPLLFCLFMLAGCRDDPQAALDAAAALLQKNLEAKATSSVYDQLAPQFLAQQTNDRMWARQTMTGVFLAYRNVRIVALSKSSHIDPVYKDKGYTEAEVALIGAEGLIPDAAQHFQVKLEWWKDGSDWKLARLDWQ